MLDNNVVVDDVIGAIPINRQKLVYIESDILKRAELLGDVQPADFQSTLRWLAEFGLVSMGDVLSGVKLFLAAASGERVVVPTPQTWPILTSDYLERVGDDSLKAIQTVFAEATTSYTVLACAVVSHCKLRSAYVYSSFIPQVVQAAQVRHQGLEHAVVEQAAVKQMAVSQLGKLRLDTKRLDELYGFPISPGVNQLTVEDMFDRHMATNIWVDNTVLFVLMLLKPTSVLSFRASGDAY